MRVPQVFGISVMWPSNWIKIESETPELLARWRGVHGQAWEYSTSHGQLLVRFYRVGSLAGAYLLCKNCSEVHFQSSWLDAHVRVGISQGKFGPVYTITDGDRLRVVCTAAFLAETPDLIWFRMSEPV